VTIRNGNLGLSTVKISKYNVLDTLAEPAHTIDGIEPVASTLSGLLSSGHGQHLISGESKAICTACLLRESIELGTSVTNDRLLEPRLSFKPQHPRTQMLVSCAAAIAKHKTDKFGMRDRIFGAELPTM
jgi:hypothetical protein